MTTIKAVLSAVIVSVITTTTVLAGQGVRPIELTPGHGQSFDLGNKRAVSYFINSDGICKLTLMLADPYTDDALPGAATRMTISVAPGKPARIDNADGTSLGFVCAPAAASMKVTETPRLAWVPRN